ncbi:MAG: hypothetical protein GVY16_06060 [Planctomycetes bacterium]|jgi:hypothetical protein|nr:hypothetical protein [Phycisphaerae bacterium]NBB95287.1 hypothetical protein [Planctomycetota bacterium]
MAANRVVILSPQGTSFCPSLGMMQADLKYEFVTSGYEAAAELLALSDTTTRALVIDFDAMGERHLPLLDIARGKDIELMGVGAFPQGLSTEHLSGMRLFAAKDLPRTLESLRPAESTATTDSTGARLTPKGTDAQFASESEPARDSQEGQVK